MYSIEPEQHLAAAYYRNTIIHFFITGAITEIALVAAADAADDPLEAFWDEVMSLRDLFKFEFFFSDKEEFRAEVYAEVAYHLPDWEDAIGEGHEAVLDLVRAFQPFTAHWVLRPFVEAYRVAATPSKRATTASTWRRSRSGTTAWRSASSTGSSTGSAVRSPFPPC